MFKCSTMMCVRASTLVTMLLASAAVGQETAGTADLTPVGRGAYVSIAGAMDLYAAQSGDLAEREAGNTGLGALGRAIADDHRRNSESTLAAARALGMDAPEPAMMPMHWEMLRQLQRRSGNRFHRLFLRQQMRVHEMTLALHRNYSANGDTPSLRAVAAAAIPIEERHLAELRAIGD